MPRQPLLIQCALVILFSLLLLWTVPATAAQDQPQADAAKTVYICGCGPACACDMVSDQPGACPCGKPLLERQVLKEDADKIYVCACADDCKCALHQADPTKCACGKELRAYPKVRKHACAHGMASATPPCANCPQQADCAGCPQHAGCADCPHRADAAGCPNMPNAEQKAPCAGCPKMPAAAN
jgi:hypothetical protein